MKRFLIAWLALAFSVSAAEPSFDLESILGILDGSPKIETVEGLMGKVPEAYRTNYVEVYASRSETPSTPKHPRIVSYGRDARTVLSYRGDPKDPSYGALQIIQFKESPKRWELYELKFPPVRDKLGKAVRPEKNPESCKECHGGEDPKPNWDGYFFWPGVYGSDDNGLFAAKGASEKEKELRKDYLKVKAAIPRYHLLREHEGRMAVNERGGPDAMNEPNSRFGHALTLHHTGLVAERIAAEKRLFPYRYAILAALTCGLGDEAPFNFSKLIPEQTLKNFKKTEKQVQGELHALERKSVRARFARHFKNLKITEAEEGTRIALADRDLRSDPNDKVSAYVMMGNLDVGALGRLKFLFDNLGVPMKGWSLDRDGLMAVNDGEESFSAVLEIELWKTWINKTADPDLYKYFEKAKPDSTYRHGYNRRLYFSGDRPKDAASSAEEERLKKEICKLLETKSPKAFELPIRPPSPVPPGSTHK